MTAPLAVLLKKWEMGTDMELPKYDELYMPLLTALGDGGVHEFKEVKNRIAEILHLDEDALSRLIPSGRQTLFANRVGWAKTYLKKAGLVTDPRRSHFQITDEGKLLLESGVTITNALLLKKYPDFSKFKGKSKPSDADEPAPAETPQETLDRVYKTINRELADELLTEIMNQSSTFFENLVVDLMKSMNYGAGSVTKSSGDGGIDGIIHEDRLGFSLIYIQAKRWDPKMTIGKPEIQKFAGAMMGPPKVEKGLFITTAKFSQGAKDFAGAQHIILVDGQRLTELMIECGLGVSVQSTYSIKRIDSDYFADNL